MKKSALLIVAIILIAGCAQSQLDTTVKTLPQTKAFLEEYPEATIKAALYSPLAIKNIIGKFIDDCPALGVEGKSYYKVTAADEPSKQQLIVWLDEKDYGFVCAIRTSTAGEKVTTTTTSAPATAPIQTTTSAQSAECSGDATRCSGDLLQSCYNGKWTLGENCAYGCDSSLPSPRCRTSPTTTLSGATTTTTSGGTTTSAAATTTVSGATTTTAAPTTSSSTTTTAAPQPDLIVNPITKFKNTTHYSFQFSVKNNGTVASTLTGIQHYVYYYDTTFGTNVSKANLVQGVDPISPGNLIVITRYFNYSDSSNADGQYYFVATIDPGNSVAESDESNNVRSVGFAKP